MAIPTKDGAIRIVCRVPRKRISIPLKDKRTFDRQIQVHIKDNFVALAVPIEAKVKNIRTTQIPCISI